MTNPTIRDIAVAAFEAGSLTAFMLQSRQGKVAFLAQFANSKSAGRFAQSQAMANRVTIAVKRHDAHCFHVAVPCTPAHRPHQAAFSMHPAPEDQASFLASLAAAGLGRA